jgi:hypothetical protein
MSETDVLDAVPSRYAIRERSGNRRIDMRGKE